MIFAACALTAIFAGAGALMFVAADRCGLLRKPVR